MLAGELVGNAKITYGNSRPLKEFAVISFKLEDIEHQHEPTYTFRLSNFSIHNARINRKVGEPVDYLDYIDKGVCITLHTALRGPEIDLRPVKV